MVAVHGSAAEDAIKSVGAENFAGPMKNNGSSFANTEEIHRHFGSMIAGAISKIIDKSNSIELGKAYSIRVNGKPIAGNGQYLNLGTAFLYHGVMAILPWDAARINALLHLRNEDYEELKVLPSIKALSNHGKDAEGYKEMLVSGILGLVSAGNAAQKDIDEIMKRLPVSLAYWSMASSIAMFIAAS